MSWRTGKKTLKVSGSRTTKLPLIEDKVSHLYSTKPDLFLAFARDRKQVIGDNEDFPKKGIGYQVILFSGDSFSYGTSADWIQTGKKQKDWSYANSAVAIDIKYSMSSQVWYIFDLEVLDHSNVVLTS